MPFSWYGPVGLNGNRSKIGHGDPEAKQWKEDPGAWHVYDIVADPGEQKSLAEIKAEVLADMRKQPEVCLAEANHEPSRRRRR